jgi:GNAT superfamily N-acetyltransferase
MLLQVRAQGVGQALIEAMHKLADARHATQHVRMCLRYARMHAFLPSVKTIWQLCASSQVCCMPLHAQVRAQGVGQARIEAVYRLADLAT